MKSLNNASPQEKDKETPDHYWDASGRFVFTKDYHLKRGYCCGEGCLHCPYDFEKVPEPRRTALKAQRPSSENG